MQNVRNALAHANGRIVEQHPDRRKELEDFAASGKMIKIIDDHIVVQEAFLSASTEAAESLVNKLIQLIASTYPAPPKSAA